jgi:hypothetical protein
MVWRLWLISLPYFVGLFLELPSPVYEFSGETTNFFLVFSVDSRKTMACSKKQASFWLFNIIEHLYFCLVYVLTAEYNRKSA